MEHIERFKYKDYTFSVVIGEEQPRWDDEGISQIVQLDVNGFNLITNQWGIEYTINQINTKILDCDNFEIIDSDFLRCKKDGIEDAFFTHFFSDKDFYFRTSLIEDPIKMEGDDYENFMVWLRFSLTPISDKRIMKINKIRKKKDYVI